MCNLGLDTSFGRLEKSKLEVLIRTLTEIGKVRVDLLKCRLSNCMYGKSSFFVKNKGMESVRKYLEGSTFKISGGMWLKFFMSMLVLYAASEISYFKFKLYNMISI